MGTNYYMYQKPDCPCCNRPYEPLHIGKSSAGWCFSLHVMPEEGINDLQDWRELWNRQGAFIRDEYDEVIPVDEMVKIITERSWERIRGDKFDYKRNQAIPGPNNLARHKVDGVHCIANGEGTWDCIVGVFS